MSHDVSTGSLLNRAERIILRGSVDVFGMTDGSCILRFPQHPASPTFACVGILDWFLYDRWGYFMGFPYALIDNSNPFVYPIPTTITSSETVIYT